MGASADSSVAIDILGMSSITLRLMRSLARRDASVSDLMDELQLSRNGVLRHLHRLREAGVVTMQKESLPTAYRPVVVYRLDPTARLDLAWVVFEDIIGPG